MAENDEKYACLDQLSTRQLEELLRADIESPESSEEGVIFHILQVIEQREKEEPTGRLPDVDKAWEEFQQYYNIPEGEGQSLYPCEQAGDKNERIVGRGVVLSAPVPIAEPVRMRHVLRQGLAAVVAVAVLLGGMVVAQASGIDVFGKLGQWTEETFHFTSSGEKDAADSGPVSTLNPAVIKYYDEVQAALEECGMPGELAPAWCPTGFEASLPEVLSDKLSDTVYVSFSNDEERFFSIDFTRCKLASYLERITFEKDDTPVEQYTSKGRTFYILSNIDMVMATWASTDDLITVSIAGNLTRDDIKTIIDSMGG